MEKKDIKDYLHLYLGVKCNVEGIEKYGWYRLSPTVLESAEKGDIKVKPMLRPLSSMTEEEAKEIWHATGGRYSVTNPKHVFTTLGHENFTSPREWFAITRLLLSKGFDLFGLIESGLAIDSTLKPV